MVLGLIACAGPGPVAVAPPLAGDEQWPSFAPVALELGPDTRAVDVEDKHPGDDGVRVRISPKDNYGHTVKWPGRIEIVLTRPVLAGKEEICRWTFSPMEAGEKWVESALSGYYFEFLPWPEGKRPKYPWSTCILKVAFTTRLGTRFEKEKYIQVSFR